MPTGTLLSERQATTEQDRVTTCRTDAVRLAVVGIALDATHGVYEEEHRTPHPFEVDVELDVEIREALVSDHLEDTVDQQEVVRVVQEVSQERQFNLIESFAHAISCKILNRFPRVTTTHVVVRKLAPYNLGSTACTKADIVSSRTERR